jgi:hypothetical protein
MIFLPRQARDRHREKSKKRWRFVQHVAYRVDGPMNGAAVVLQHGYSSQKEHWLAYVSALVAAVSKNVFFFEPFLYKCDRFTKTGSGQT